MEIKKTNLSEGTKFVFLLFTACYDLCTRENMVKN